MSDWPEETRLLEQFQQWLAETRSEVEDFRAALPAPTEPSAAGPHQPVGLCQVVEAFTALRQELKLQTKSGRALQEQTAALVQACEALLSDRTGPPRSVADPQAGRAFAEALADLDDQVERGWREIERLPVPGSAPGPAAVLAAAYERLGPWQRWLARSYHQQALAALAAARPALPPETAAAVRDGYALLRSRLARTLQGLELERMDCTGRPVDLSRMTVLEVVDDPASPAGQVAAELRRGYLWRGEVLRLAEVRAVRERAGEPRAALSGIEGHED